MSRPSDHHRARRGKIITAEGEAMSAGKLAEEADVIAGHPTALQLHVAARSLAA